SGAKCLALQLNRKERNKMRHDEHNTPGNATYKGRPLTKNVQKWADGAMFKAAPIDPASGPRVQLLSCNSDPLGTIAAAAKMYKGEYVESLAHISDDERRHYLSDVQKNALAAPLEFVNFHFLISGVTRGF